MSLRSLFLVFIVFFTTRLSPLIAQSDGPIAFDARNFDAERAQMSLVVAGASARAEYMIAGHMILRVRQGNDDYSFDWGVFDPSKDNFVFNYIRGHLDYEHIVRPFHYTIRIYQHEHRQLTDYPLNLTTKQKQTILDKLADWAKEENRVYAYNILFRNCSTVVGGLIADVAGPSAQEVANRPVSHTLRSIGLAYFGHFPLIQLFTDIVGGNLADGPATERDLFYLPVRVVPALKDAFAYNDDGQQQTYKLLGEPTVLVNGDDVAPLDVSWPLRVGIVLAIVFAVLAGLVGTDRLRGKWLLIASVPYLMLLGLIGIIIIFLRFFSMHTFTWYNEHMYFIWPTDGLVWVLFLPFVQRRWPSLTPKKVWTMALWYAGLHVAAIVITTLGNLFFVVPPQDITAGWKMVFPYWLIILALAAKKSGKFDFVRAEWSREVPAISKL